MKSNPNLILGWLWILLGFVSGMALGMFFHGENWLGGYGSFQRRMYRLGHISFFGLGAINLLFWLTMQRIAPSEPLAGIASWAFIVGAVTMPVCCVVMAHRPRAHLIFAVPVVSLIAGGVLTLILIFRDPTTGLISTRFQPGVEPSLVGEPFQRFAPAEEPLKWFSSSTSAITGLKPDVSDRHNKFEMCRLTLNNQLSTLNPT